MTRRPKKRHGSFYKLTAALKRVWEKCSGSNSPQVVALTQLRRGKALAQRE